MKFLVFIFSISLSLIFSPTITAQSLDEKKISINYSQKNHHIIDTWSEYFNQRYLTNKESYDDIVKEGTGYLPFLRAKLFYDSRKMENGHVSTENLWKTFKLSREKSINYRGAKPVANWINLGPNKMDGVSGGRMISHAFDPKNHEIIWAGSASGGLWKSENGGDLWEPMSDEIPSTGIGAIAINPQNRNSMLIGTGEGYFLGVSVRPGIGVFRSDDRGLTWKETFFNFQPLEGVSVFKIIWNPIDTSIVHLAATNGIWKSVDGGKTWNLKFGNGETWNTVADDLAMNPNNPDIIYAAIEDDGIYKSIDGGDIWNRLSNGLPSVGKINFISLDICRDQPNTLYASMTNSVNFGLEGLFKTDDSGDSWFKIENAPNALCTSGTFNYCQGYYDNTVAVSPFDPNHILIGGVTFWNTKNGGDTWTQHDTYTCPNCANIPPGHTYVDHHDIGFHPSDKNTVYNFCDGGVSKSTNGGTFWIQKNEGLINAQFYSIASALTDTSILSGGFQDFGLQATNLSNPKFKDNLWRRWGFLDGSGSEIDYTNASILYGTWIDGRIIKNSTGINTQGTYFINNGIPANERTFSTKHPFQIDPFNPEVLYYASGKKIYKTTNGGLQWKPKSNIPNVSVIEVDVNNQNYVYAASWTQAGNWNFWRSTNKGENWSVTSESPGWRVTDIESDPNNPGTIYATRNSFFDNNPHVYRSTDYGNTWNALKGNLPDITVNAIAINPYDENWIYLATDLGVYMSEDKGTSWFEYNTGMPITFVMDIHFHPVDSTLRIGTLGRGAWKTKSIPNKNPSSITNLNKIDFEIGIPFPNPATEQVTIPYSLSKSGNIKIIITNNMGQKIAVLLNKKQNSGNYSINWNLLNKHNLKVTSGIYYISIIKNNYTVSKKIIIN